MLSEDILQRLGMELEAVEEDWHVTAPSFRFDIAIEVDLIEEIGRIVGYSNLPSTRPMGSLTCSRAPRGRLASGSWRGCW